MYAHVIKDGVVVNTVVVDSIDGHPDMIEATDGGIGWLYDGENISPPPSTPAAIPASVSPRQIRQALTRAGLRNQVETTISVADRDTKDWWEFATSIERNHPQVVAMSVALGQTEQQIDDLFVLAASL